MAFTIDQLLIFAVRAKNTSLIHERIRLGANPNYLDSHHGSAAVVAVRNNDVDTLSILLEAGLDPSDVGTSEFGLIETAIQCGSSDAAKFLINTGFTLQEHSKPTYQDALQNLLTSPNPR